MRLLLFFFIAVLWPFCYATLWAQETDPFQFEDIFHLKFAVDPQISGEGKYIAYLVEFMDIQKDKSRSNLWLVSTNGKTQSAITSGPRNDSQPRWSKSADRIAFVSKAEERNQIMVYSMADQEILEVTELSKSPSNISWSPDGKWIAFTLFVPLDKRESIEYDFKPTDAEWAPPAKYIDHSVYRSDGEGYMEHGFSHLFVVSSTGGEPRQITSGDKNYDGSPVWTPDGQNIIMSANLNTSAFLEPLNTDLHQITVSNGTSTQLTDRDGPENSPSLSPDGNSLAYVGFDDRLQGYQVQKLYILDLDKRQSRVLINDLDRDVENPIWSVDGSAIFFSYDSEGNSRIARVSLSGEIQDLAKDMGGSPIGRPYAAGSYSVDVKGNIVYSKSTPVQPPEVVWVKNGKPKVMTSLNKDLLDSKNLSQVEELWIESSYDQRKIQAWIVKPPNFDPTQKYPLLLEIHGGPFANYGDRFSAEIQLYAAAGYVVLYLNPRGSTSYGQEFGNLIHHAYPSQDYDDLMSAVDAVISQGFVDTSMLYVTGGSGGGVLTAWIVGKTNRFRAAVVAKPVINWYSFSLTADMYNFFYKYWFPGYPWDYPEEYLKRSPLSLVGNVQTPTMLLSGEQDFRTPISESEQYYQALKLRGVETAMVRIPKASHSIAKTPSYLIQKVDYILMWFERFR